MAALLPYHVTHSRYTTEQASVYHDHSDCPESKKIDPGHWIDGSGGRPRCKEYETLHAAIGQNAKAEIDCRKGPLRLAFCLRRECSTMMRDSPLLADVRLMRSWIADVASNVLHM